MWSDKHLVCLSNFDSEEHDGSYFALLEKFSRLEAEKSDLQVQVDHLKSDAQAYEEVALEMEESLKAATIDNEKHTIEIAELKAQSNQSAIIISVAEARLALAEEIITALKKETATPLRNSLCLPSLGIDSESPISDGAVSMGSAQLPPFPRTFPDTPPIVLIVHRQPHPWSADCVDSTSSGNTSAYSSKSPIEKISSDLPALPRCSSVPTTAGEQMATINRNLQHDPETSRRIKDLLAIECVQESAVLLPVQANHMHNTSLRHVSDTRKFWKVFTRQKFNQALGFKRSARASVRRSPASGDALLESTM